MSALREIKSLDEWHAHLAALAPSTLLVVSFHAPWAAPCAQMATVLEALAAEYPADGRTSWVSVNAEELSDVSEQYDVTAVPFLVLLRGGQVVDTVSGSSAVKVRAAIEAAAAAATAATTATSSTTATPANGAAATTNGASTAAAPLVAAAATTTTTTTTSSDTDLNTRLAALVRAAPVMLFMKGTPSAPQCGFSRQLVALLRERGVKYGFFNILADDEVRQGLKTFADWPTYPQLWVDGELVGGLDIVKEELASDADFFGAYSVQPQQQQTAAEGHSNAATATAV